MAIGQMIDWVMIRDTLDAWLTACGVSYSWAGQAVNPPQRVRPYAVLHIIGSETLGRDGSVPRTGPTPESVYLENQGQRIISIQVDAIADAVPGPVGSAMDLAERLRGSLRTQPIVDIFFGKMGVSNAGEVLDLTAVENSQHMGRAVFTIRFAVGASDAPEATTYDNIRQLEVTGELLVRQNPDVTITKTSLVGG